MWISSGTVLVFLLQALLWGAFVPDHHVSAFRPMMQKRPVPVILTNHHQQHAVLFNAVVDDCGCSPDSTIVFSGKPSNEARRSNPRKAIKDATSSIYDVNGKVVALEDLLTKGNRDVSIVVFLRSLG
jgi:hypothetical protein